MDSDSRTAVIRNVLNQYPFSIGIFREIVQNSEDAKASKQVFLLDCRSHPPATLSGIDLSHTNGPALLAFNDATFRPDDWKALLATYGSSKRMDVSKIGKNGMGFRACFHITNYPQVYSKDTMLMLDPQGDFFAEGEAKATLGDIPIEIQESLSLEWFREIQGQGSSPGTIIRLPLRTEDHRREISSKTVSCREVKDHFQAFIQTEMDISLLFLSSVQSIEFWIVEEGPIPSRIAFSRITLLDNPSPNNTTLKKRVETVHDSGPNHKKDWLIRWHSVPNSVSQDQLSVRIGCDAKSTMKKEKLTAMVALAIQVGILPEGYRTPGKLFTYLPLPSDTNFPCNIHAPFALTIDRQGLRNENEEGFPKGSDDHIRVEWNRYLFDTVIPAAWGELLHDLSKLSPSLFSAWPSTHRMPSGCSYWQCVPEKALRWIVDNNITIWPVQGSSTAPTYHPYKDILIAPPTINTPLLGAFASAGSAITQPPQEVYNLARTIRCDQLLTPELVHSTILSNPPIPIDRDSRHLLLDYLLSTSRTENLIGIPLIEQVDGSVIALSQREDTSSTYVILGEQDYEVFHKFAPHAIPSTGTNPPNTVAHLLKSTSLLNVEQLGVGHVISFITQAPSHFGPFTSASSNNFIQYVVWVSRFFEWLQCSPLENVLSGHIHTIPLLPVQSGELRPISSCTFSVNHTHANNGLVELLQSLGLSFLHPGVSTIAQKYLDPNLKSLNNPSHVFTSLPPLHQTLSDKEIHTLQDYILLNRWNIQKDPTIQATIRDLPIFNHMVPSNLLSPPLHNVATNYVTMWSTIPDHVTLRVVASNITLLPMIPNTFFTSQLSLAQVFDQSLGITSKIDIVQLAIDHFQSQPSDLQARFLELLSTLHIPSTTLSQLKSIPFLLGADGNLHAPQALVDPTNRLANLLPPHSSHLPQYQTVSQQKMVNSVKSLTLLLNFPTVEIYQEIINVIITKQDTKLSKSLLDFLDNYPRSKSIPDLLLHHKWLDTTHGLSSPADSYTQQFAELCNRVSPILRRTKQIQSQELLLAFRWDSPPPLLVVVAQFKALVSEENTSCPELSHVISFLGSHLKELSRRGYLQELEQFVKGRSWVPTHGSTLAPAAFAVFKQDFIIHPFKQIRPQFADTKDKKAFLQKMGCMETPSGNAISLVLQDIGNIPADEVVAFLRAVPEQELKLALGNTDATLPIIPTTDGVLKGCSVTHFNDLGPYAGEVPLPAGHFLASDHIDRKLATKLGLSFLSDIIGSVDDDELIEMKEDLTTRISSVLLSYTKEQAFMEFLANAADARATEFGITFEAMQHHPPENLHFISPSMKGLCTQPSLILHNNGVFSPSDWMGMCNVGSTNKQEGNDGKSRIGRFGLGSLSMFYFTEVAMILSGKFVLFMDPRKAYLGRNHSCKKVSLEKMKRFFPAHLSPLDGHYGYKCSMDYYDGTLFKLHLRTEQQARQSTIYRRSFDREDIEELINNFKRHAQHTLLFIPIVRIKVSHPHPSKRRQELWVVEKSTVNLAGFGSVIKIHHSPLSSKLWSVLFKTIPLQDVPLDFHECLSSHKIQAISVGIAGAIDTPPSHHKPFSYIPLPHITSLPVHLHCTFILSDDRRGIRYDEEGNGNPESKFNKWLLTEKVPFLYLQFLSGWKLDDPMDMCPWWPKRTTTDKISQVVVGAMHTILPKTCELISDNHSGSRVAPLKAYFLQPSCPTGILLALCPEDLARIPPGFFHLASLQTVDREYLTTTLHNNADRIISMYKEGTFTVKDVVDVVKFLLKPPSPDSSSSPKFLSSPDFLGLPLLPLADGSPTLLSAGNTTFYCPLPEHEKLRLPFPLHHFLDPKVTDEHATYNLLQVQKLDSKAVSRFIRDKIPAQNTFSSTDLKQWFEDLWKLLDTIPGVTIEDSAFQDLPIIPIHGPEPLTWISFQILNRSDVLFIESPTNVPLDACVALGMKVIEARSCEGKLREAIKLSRGKQPKGILRTILGFFIDQSQKIPACFRGLNHDLHSQFSEWLRERLRSGYYSLSNPEKTIVGRLPLWEAVRIGRAPARFVSANEAKAIPENISPEVVRMWPAGSITYIPTDHLLSLMKKPDDPPIFYRDQLTFPPFIKTVTPTYKMLLKQVLNSPHPHSSILVPNVSGTMKLSSNLYLSSDPTFSAAFASQTKMFLHEELRDLEERLCSWGLISTLTGSSFRACALAIAQDSRSRGIHTRALTVFRKYNTEMPPELMKDRVSRNELRNLRFIPRNVGATRYGTIPIDDYLSLPNIVSPSETVDPEHFRIAWTQRAECLEEPSPELRSVNKLDPNPAWMPTAREVIEHLRILSKEIAPDLPHNSELIKDLKATYSWLASHASEAEDLLNHNSEKLFLNVDNPDREWRWDSASELYFDERDSSDPFRVRQFLRDYDGLLCAAGVTKVNYPPAPSSCSDEDSHETQWGQIRIRFNEMREAGKLTDVTFVANDGTRFLAHRVFLAAWSDHFMTMFARGGWRESRNLEEEVEIKVGYSRECLRAVLDWIYKGSYDLPEGEAEKFEVLVEMYRLAHYWGFEDSDLFKGLTRELIESISVGTYECLKELAEELSLEDGSLAKTCEKFESMNRVLLAER